MARVTACRCKDSLCTHHDAREDDTAPLDQVYEGRGQQAVRARGLPSPLTHHREPPARISGPGTVGSVRSRRLTIRALRSWVHPASLFSWWLGSAVTCWGAIARR